MNINDPFGRMARRDQQAYETMREALRNSGVATEEAAREIIQLGRSRATKFAAIGAAVLLLVSVALPKAMPVAVGLGLLAAIWTLKSMRDGQRHVERYISEEIKK